MQRTRVLWDGIPGGQGYTNLFSRVSNIGTHDPTLHLQDTANFFASFNSRIPLSISLSISPEVVYFEDTTGEQVAFDVVPDPPSIPGVGGAGSFAAAAGAAFEWSTAGVINSRRVTGRTFAVPLVNNSFDNNGTLSTAALEQLNDAADVYVNESTSGPVVWSRPAPGRPGASFSITGGRVRDRVAVLRTRRS